MFNAKRTAAAAGLLLLFQSATGPPADGGERHVVFTNNCGEPIIEIHVSTVGAGDWQDDLLGSDFLSPGQSVLLNVDDENNRCRVDVKAVLDDGSNRIDHGVDVCRDEGDAISLR